MLMSSASEFNELIYMNSFNSEAKDIRKLMI